MDIKQIQQQIAELLPEVDLSNFDKFDHENHYDKLNQIINYTKIFNDPILKKLWLDILKTELQNPNIIARKLINIIADFDPEILYVVQNVFENVVPITNNRYGINLDNITWSDLLLLQNYGLVFLDTKLISNKGNVELIKNKQEFFDVYNNFGLCCIMQKDDKNQPANFDIKIDLNHILSPMGCQFYDILQNLDYIKPVQPEIFYQYIRHNLKYAGHNCTRNTDIELLLTTLPNQFKQTEINLNDYQITLPEKLTGKNIMDIVKDYI